MDCRICDLVDELDDARRRLTAAGIDEELLVELAVMT
jgi:hypothetical protein